MVAANRVVLRWDVVGVDVHDVVPGGTCRCEGSLNVVEGLLDLGFQIGVAPVDRLVDERYEKLRKLGSDAVTTSDVAGAG